jgi:O-antigen ligase
MHNAQHDSARVHRLSADAIRGLFLCLALAATALVFSYRLTSFWHAKEAVLAVCLCGAAFSAAVRGRFPIDGLRAYLPLWLLAAYGLCLHTLVLPAQVPSRVVEESARLAMLLLTAALAYDLLRQERWRTRLTATFLTSAVLAALLGILQYFRLLPWLFPVFPGNTQRMYSVFGNPNALGDYLAMAFPLFVFHTAASKRIPLATLCAGVAVLAGLALSGSRTAWLAAALGTAVVLGIERKKLSRRRVLGILVGAAVVLIILGALAPDATCRRFRETFSAVDEGFRARLWFWAGTVQMIAGERPFCGVGFGNYAYWSPYYLGAVLHAPGGHTYEHNLLHTLHAHSEPLEILAELGIPGLALCLWMFVRLLRHRGPEWGPLVAILTAALFNFPFHCVAHALAGLFFAGMLLARDAPRTPSTTVFPPSWSLALLACCTGAAAFFLWAVIVPSHWLRTAYDEQLADRSPFEAYERVINHPWPHALAEAKLGIALGEEGREVQARRHLLNALKGADTGDIYWMLGFLAAREGDREEAAKWLDACIWRWPSYFDAWAWRIHIATADERTRLLGKARVWLTPEQWIRLEERFTPGARKLRSEQP